MLGVGTPRAAFGPATKAGEQAPAERATEAHRLSLEPRFSSPVRRFSTALSDGFSLVCIPSSEFEFRLSDVAFWALRSGSVERHGDGPAMGINGSTQQIIHIHPVQANARRR